MSKTDTDRIFREAKRMASRNPNATNKDLCGYMKRAKQLATRDSKITSFLLTM